tara:strand:- start:4409 stop:4681 length:273 start_codon:yes stop_codon:yes gene_type:complete
MACCGGGGGSKRSVRKQVVERSEKTKQIAVQRVRRSAAPTGGQNKQIVMARQHVAPHQKCQKCGFPTMSVNIAGRERLQCSNPDCRIVVK